MYKGDKLGDRLYGLSLGGSVAANRHAEYWLTEVQQFYSGDNVQTKWKCY